MITNVIQAISVDCTTGSLGFRIASEFEGEQIREYTAILSAQELGADFGPIAEILATAIATKYGEAVSFPALG